ncbi:hypothetical protein CFAEC_04285 [Corynebacterium faecale]|nr:hypothetical protein CFAEC_04285 [Corynebacterium faecale]
MTTDPALHTSVAIDGEATHTSLDVGRVVLESFHNRTHTVIYAGPADAYSYSGQLNTDLPLDRARREWSSEQKFAYARKIFDDSAEQIFNLSRGLKKILDAEYPGGSELAAFCSSQESRLNSLLTCSMVNCWRSLVTEFWLANMPRFQKADSRGTV